MTHYTGIRCPHCNRLQAQAANGSDVRIVCRHCKKAYTGVVKEEKFHIQNDEGDVRPGIRSSLPPHLTG